MIRDKLKNIQNFIDERDYLSFDKMDLVQTIQDLVNECSKLQEDLDWIHKWKPFLHACCEWDGLIIDKGDPEFDCCTCFNGKSTGESNCE